MTHSALHHVVRRDLPNGVRLVHVHTDLPISFISLWFPFGSRQDPKGKEGMAHFLEHLLMKTTPALPTVGKMRAFCASRGIRYNAMTAAETVRFQFEVLSEDAPSALPLFLEQLRESFFDRARCESERLIIQDERSRKAQRPMDMLAEWTREALFPGSGIDHSGLGTEASVAGITYEGVLAFAQANVLDAPKTFVICSPHHADTFVGPLSALPLQPRPAHERPVSRLAAAPVPSQIVKSAASNVAVSLAYATCGYADIADVRALHLLAQAYLAGGAASRLKTRLREEQSMTYAVQGETQAYTDCGSFAIRFSVPKERLQEALAVCEEELARLRDGVIDTALLDASKKDVRFNVKSRCMNPESVVAWYALREMHGHGFETFDEYCAAIDQLTPEDLARVARQYFVPERRSLVLLGDVEHA